MTHAKGRKWLYFVIGLILLAVIAESTLMVLVWRTTKKEYAPRPADAIIILGGRVKPDGSMSLTLSRRTEKGFEAWQKGLGKKFIVCGGQGADEPFSEAKAMTDYLVQLGVPEDSIFQDDQSVNTYQNLVFAREIMAQQGLKDAIIVTSDYHVTRAMWLCADVGIEAQGYPSLGPDGWLNQLKALAKEGLSWVKYWVFQVLNLNP